MKERDYLLMPIWATMQSWGDQVVAGDDRPTLSFPTHSGLCGLIAAALGLERSEHSRLRALHQSLNFIILDICKGALQTDFYSVKGFVRAERLKVAPKATIIGRKTYMTDSAFLIAAYLTDEGASFSLAEIGKALLQPHYPLYAGRKSYPFHLPPVYHKRGIVPLFRWQEPYQEMIRLRTQEETEFQKPLKSRQQSKPKNLSEALFKNRFLPDFSKEEKAYFYCDDPAYREDSIPYQIQDRYLANPLKTRHFDERTVYSISIHHYKTNYAVSE